LAASAVVSFAASLPISFAGWGIRELSAVMVLGLIGIQSGPALTISITMGALALAALILLSGVGFLMPQRKETTSVSPSGFRGSFDVVKLAQRGIPLIAVTAVFFQLYIPAGKTLLNVNLADPIAILGAVLFLYYFARRKSSRWRMNGLNGHVLIATVVVILAFLHGYHRFGWNDWAFSNKMLGWFVLLCYGATGALIVASDRADFRLLIRTFVGTAIGVVMLDLILLVINTAIVRLPNGFIQIPLDGFSQNRNAFAFILTLAVCCVFIMPRKLQPWVLGILLAGLCFAGSRACWGASAIVLVLAILKRITSVRMIALGAIVAAVVIALISALPELISEDLGSSVARRPGMWRSLVSPPSSNVERFKSILDGLELFRSSPIFGAGLGGYVATTASGERPVIIHSTAVWLLAEMGIIGLLAFAIPAIRILKREWMQPDPDAAAKLIILILIAFAAVSMVHEMLYQRTMWLLLGAALAYIPRNAGLDTAISPTRD
jgi:hypothetical protein